MSRARDLADIADKDITGTLTVDGLTVDTDAYRRLLLTYPDAFTSKLQIGFTNFYVQGSATNDRLTIANNSSGQTHFENQSKTSMVIDNSGDISFYEDTGTTPKFFWDASAESLGIGTSSPSSYWANADDLVVATSGNTGISVVSGTSSLGYLIFADSTAGGDNTRGGLGYDHSTNNMLFRVNNDTKMTLDSGGNVGIGTSSPATALHVNSGAANEVARFESTDTEVTLELKDTTGTAKIKSRADFRFETGATPSEAMRIDSSGQVGIGSSAPGMLLEVDASSGSANDIARFSGRNSGGLTFRNATANEFILHTATSDALIFGTNGNNERMRIDSSGNVGIGTSSPATPLDVTKAGGGNFVATFQNTTSATPYGVHIKDAASGANGYPLLQVTNSAGSSPYLLVHSGTGNVGIGTSSPRSALDIDGGVDTHIRMQTNSTGSSSLDGLLLGLDGSPNALAYFWNYENAPVIVGTNNTERMRIDNSGRVMIGTTTEGQVQAGNLTIADSGNMGMTLRSTDSGETSIFFSDGTSGAAEYAGWLQYVHSSNRMTFGTNSTERMRLTSGGYLALGNSLLPTNGTAGVTLAPEGNVHCGVATTANTNVMRFDNPNGRVGSISTTNSSTSYNTSSDYRLKTDAQPMTGASARVQALNPVNFEWLSDGTRVDGFLAHEAQAVVPEAVTGAKDAVDADGNPDYQGIDQSKLVPLLTAALQEALTKIDALETRITALEG